MQNVAINGVSQVCTLVFARLIIWLIPDKPKEVQKAIKEQGCKSVGRAVVISDFLWPGRAEDLQPCQGRTVPAEENLQVPQYPRYFYCHLRASPLKFKIKYSQNYSLMILNFSHHI